MFVKGLWIDAPDSLAGSAEMSDAPYLATTKASSSQKVPAGSFFFEFRTFREGRRTVAQAWRNEQRISPLCHCAIDPEILVGAIEMAKHMPQVPPANRSNKGTGGQSEALPNNSLKHFEPQNIAEQGATANIKQNTTNKGYFRGRRMQ